MTLETPLLAALNRLLRAEGWARERLAPFAGETVELRPAWLPALRFSIVEGGLLGEAPAGAQPSLAVTLKADAPAALLQGEEQLLRSVEVSGNARLADEVRLLVRHLRWDYEEELSRVVGDVAAHRLAEAARGFVAWQADAARRLAAAFADYAAQEKQLLVRRPELEWLGADIAALRDAVERLAQRVRRLE
ncbi:MAG TPA: hypothetical protein VFX09_08150 [Burkholderiales bacterium]|nr:hypothetical protein [Burkholderiales bacterium]